MPNPALLDAARTARVYDLAHDVSSTMPVAPVHPPYVMGLMRRHGDAVRDDGVSTANEIIVMCAHTGTHIDALGHASHDMRAYGGRDAAQLQAGGRGLRELGAEHIPPILARGVLLDVAGHLGVARLDGGQGVGRELLQETAAAQGVSIGAGDAVLVRTGWGTLWEHNAEYVAAGTGAPGVNEDGASWLADQGIVLGGSDTLAFEATPAGANVRPVHRLFLVERGIHIVESLALEELAADRLHEFLFIVGSVKFVGATGSPVRPLAIA